MLIVLGRPGEEVVARGLRGEGPPRRAAVVKVISAPHHQVPRPCSSSPYRSLCRCRQRSKAFPARFPSSRLTLFPPWYACPPSDVGWASILFALPSLSKGWRVDSSLSQPGCTPSQAKGGQGVNKWARLQRGFLHSPSILMMPLPFPGKVDVKANPRLIRAAKRVC